MPTATKKDQLKSLSEAHRALHLVLQTAQDSVTVCQAELFRDVLEELKEIIAEIESGAA